MTTETPESYVARKGWQVKQEGTQLKIKVCPLCQKSDWKFYINATTGAWDCKHGSCGKSGSLYQLKELLGDIGHVEHVQKKPTAPPKMLSSENIAQYQGKFFSDTSTLEYLKGRGLTPETIGFFRLGIRKFEGANWLAIPHFIKGTVRNIKYRSIPPAEKAFKRVTDCESVLFNADALEGADTIYFCEGEIDTMTLWQHGIKNVIGGTLGAGSLSPSWFDDLAAVTKIILVQDNDEAGQKGAREIAKRLGLNRCLNVVLPVEPSVKDVNEYLLKHSITDFMALPQTPFPIKNVSTLGSTLQRLIDERERKKEQPSTSAVKPPWDDMAKLTGAFDPGDMIVVGAQPKTGKTSLCLEIARQTALDCNPVLFYCLEMPPEQLAEKIVQAQNDIAREQITPQILSEALAVYEELPLYFGFDYKHTDLEIVTDTIREATARFGLKLVVFDNLNYLVRQGANIAAEVGIVTKTMKLLAMELEIPIILLAQPKKLDTDRMMTMNDLRDSLLIAADADMIILLHRKRVAGQGGNLAEQAFENQMRVRVEAGRRRQGGECWLYFEGAHSNFRQMTKR